MDATRMYGSALLVMERCEAEDFKCSAACRDHRNDFVALLLVEKALADR
jgi:hypothetical protein